MHLSQLLVIASASATSVGILGQQAALCSASIKSLEASNNVILSVAGDESKNAPAEFTEAESAALFGYYCSKDKSCASGSSAKKGHQLAGAEVTISPTSQEIEKKLHGNETSISIFKWGYQVYIPSVVIVEAQKQADDSCGFLTKSCQEKANKFEEMDIGTMLFCKFVSEPAFTCVKYMESIKEMNKNGNGVVISATWVTATYPKVESGDEYVKDQ